MKKRNRVALVTPLPWPTEVVLTGCRAQCTKCGKVKTLDRFGLRYIWKGRQVRNQPQCKECR